MAVTTMPFGKHKGLPLTELPDDYLDWLLQNVEMRPPLQHAIHTEVERRRGPGRAAVAPVVAPVGAGPVGVLPRIEAFEEFIVLGLEAANRARPDQVVEFVKVADWLRRSVRTLRRSAS